MTMPNSPIEGACRCGKVRFAITKPPILTMACHCTGCQKMSGSAFSLSVAVPTDGFEVTQGETVLGGLHARGQEHQHCDWCKSWTHTVLDPTMGFVNVRAGVLDDPSWFAPFVESYTSEKLPWAETGARHSFAQFPAPEDYGRLLGEFVEQR
ncbi:GFA family protein [Sphingomonas koreensis]|nr:GFA family protein [Sphingomonas koreensis]